MSPVSTNWAGNITFSGPVRQPSSLGELQDLVAGADRVRVVGSRHSFNDIADGDGVLVSVEGIESPIDIDPVARTVAVGGGVRYAQLCRELAAAGWALPNLGSLPHISVAGACATGTHGSGDHNGVLATSVCGLDLVTADGSIVSLRRDADRDRFSGTVVSLGMLGVVVRLTLDVVPGFDVTQSVYDDLSWSVLTEDLDRIFAAGYSVSVFTRWQPDTAGMLWIKRRSDESADISGDVFGARPADGPRHPIAGMPVDHATDQGARPGPWHARLPHFRAGFVPSAGQELQSEYLLPRHHAAAAVDALREIGGRIGDVLLVCELRTVAADDLWLSPAYRQDVFAIHFTWVDDTAAVVPVVSQVEGALAPFDARPHWGKVFTSPPDLVRSRYPRMNDFARLARDLDPAGTFRNAFTDRYIP